MKNIIKNIRKALGLSALAISAFSLHTSAFAQPTTLVKPRQYVLESNLLLTAKQYLSTNGTGNGANVVACWTNTLTPYSGSHPIGLSLNVQTTNNLAGPSNVVISVYPAYDTYGGGGNTTIGTSFGTNFATVPIFVWTASYQTNAIINTNLPSTLWEPATALGFTLSNGCNSNTTITLVMSQAP